MNIQAEVQVGPQGRVVIPAQLRKLLNLKPGEVLIAHVENESLVFEKAEVIKRRLKARFAHLPQGMSLADELIAERRAASEGENET